MPIKQESLIDLLREVNQSISGHVRNVLSQHGLGFTTMIIIRQIKVEPGITISELARRSNIAKSHISNTIKELGIKGWVETQTDSRDRRILRLYLSKSGIENLEMIAAAIRERLSNLLSGISETRTVEIIESIRDIQAALKKANEKERKQ
jgi:DNA-binding MarR family transcriptional regulator